MRQADGRPRVRSGTDRGFSLIEILVVVIVVAVLASIAMPHYAASVQRSHRVHAQGALLQTAQWLERAATAQGVYPERVAIPPSVLSVEGHRYTIEFSALSANAYTLRAIPRGAQEADPCGVFELNEVGIRTQAASARVPAPLPAQACWSR